MGIRRRDGVTYEPSGDTVVILDADGTVMTTLNPVGAVIWNSLDGRDSAELAHALVTEFSDADVEQLKADIDRFVEELGRSKLVTID